MSYTQIGSLLKDATVIHRVDEGTYERPLLDALDRHYDLVVDEADAFFHYMDLGSIAKSEELLLEEEQFDADPVLEVPPSGWDIPERHHYDVLYPSPSLGHLYELYFWDSYWYYSFLNPGPHPQPLWIWLLEPLYGEWLFREDYYPAGSHPPADPEYTLYWRKQIGQTPEGLYIPDDPGDPVIEFSSSW